jgi:hypothetical protein
MAHSPGIGSNGGLTRTPGWDIQKWKKYELAPPFFDGGDEGPSPRHFLDHRDASFA